MRRPPRQTSHVTARRLSFVRLSLSHPVNKSAVAQTNEALKFRDALRSRTKRAQINEALCKVLCHNICCLIQAMYELGLKPKFYAQVA